jgi:predicted lipoprotein
MAQTKKEYTGMGRDHGKKIRAGLAAFAGPFIASLLVAAPGSSLAAGEPDYQHTHEIMANAINDFVRPGYARLETAASGMVGKTITMCSEPGQDTLAATRDAFRETVMAWSHIEIIRFGPVTSGNRFERILFYPDRKGTGLRQVQRLLAGDEAVGWRLEDLQEQSVAIQGLGGIEFALYGTGSAKLADPTGASRCRYVELAARNIEDIAGQLSEAWAKEDGIASIWMNPGPQNRVFRDNREALSQLIGAMIHGLETVRDIRLGSITGTANKQGNPQTAIYRRSGLTMQSVAANLEAVSDLFTSSKLELLLDEEYGTLGDQVRFELDQTIETASDLDGDPQELVANPVTSEKLDYLRQAIRFAIERLNGEFSAASGLAAGFSFGDGD